MTKTKEENAPFAVVDVDDLKSTKVGQKILADLESRGVQFVTRDEMRFLKEWSWGPDAYRMNCISCGTEMVFERHPADWPNVPGDPNIMTTVQNEDGEDVEVPSNIRVAVECPNPACGMKQFTDGIDTTGYVTARRAAVYAEVMEEVNRRLTAENGSEPVEIQHISASDTGDGGDRART